MQVLVNNRFKVMIGMLIIVLLIPTFGGSQTRRSVIPKNGFVPDKETAVKIAEAVWIPIYGVEEINQERPFVAELKNGIWIVSGTLHSEPGSIAKGGVATIEISKADGRVLRVSHEK